MQTLDRHLTAHSLRAIALVAASLTSMMLLFAFFDELSESADRYGFDDVLNYLWRTLPRRLEELMLYSVVLVTWSHWDNWLSKVNSQRYVQRAYHLSGCSLV